MRDRPTGAGYIPHRFCSHQRFSTKSDHGRDQEVSPVRKRCHTSRTALGLIEVCSQLLFSSASSTTALISPRSHRSKGSVNPRLGRFTISLGNSTPRLASSRLFGKLPCNFLFPGIRKQASTIGR